MLLLWAVYTVWLLFAIIKTHFCCLNCLHHAKIVNNFYHLTFTVAKTCHKALKHVSKYYNIFCVVFICHRYDLQNTIISCCSCGVSWLHVMVVSRKVVLCKPALIRSRLPPFLYFRVQVQSWYSDKDQNIVFSLKRSAPYKPSWQQIDVLSSLSEYN